MKRAMQILLWAAAVLSALTLCTLAAGTTETAGMYDITTQAQVTLTPRAADGTEISPTAQGTHVRFYADAVQFDLTASGLEQNAQYLLLVLRSQAIPTKDNIVYIHQLAADAAGTVSFSGENTAYPSALETGNYYVYLVGKAREFDTARAAATFAYDKPYTLGDVNEDARIDSEDALLALQFFVKSKIPTAQQSLAADVTNDGRVDSEDALKILLYFVKKIESFT